MALSLSSSDLAILAITAILAALYLFKDSIPGLSGAGKTSSTYSSTNGGSKLGNGNGSAADADIDSRDLVAKLKASVSVFLLLGGILGETAGADESFLTCFLSWWRCHCRCRYS